MAGAFTSVTVGVGVGRSIGGWTGRGEGFGVVDVGGVCVVVGAVFDTGCRRSRAASFCAAELADDSTSLSTFAASMAV